MNKTYLFILCILFLKITQGQRTSGNLKSYTVKGSLIDQETLQPLEYGTISLVNKNNPKQIQGGITDSSGVFNIQLPAGTYDFKAEFIGFVPFTIKNLMISETKDFGQIGLKISQNLLNEIELIAEKTEVEIRLDKRIYNVGKDLTVRGGNVADVLGNVPSVSVDLEGNVSLRGNDNVRILINGKPSGLVGISGPQGLQNLPAESIEKVEVITSPSARYGAEGTAGIINVVLRKDNLNGLNGNFVANGGIPERYSGSLNVNYRTKKVNIFSTNSILNNLNIGRISNDTEFFNNNEPNTFGSEIKRIEFGDKSLFSSLGVEFNIKEKTSLIINSFLRTEDGVNRFKTQLDQFDSTKLLVETTNLDEVNRDDDNAFQFSTNFDTEFKKGDKLTAVFQYEKNGENELSEIENTNPLRNERVEDSEIIIKQLTTEERNDQNYTKFFPTLNFSYKFNDSKSIIIGFSRRISRPRARLLNPFLSRSGITNFFQGNPNLTPSYSNTVDLGFLRKWDKLTFNSSIYFQKSSDVVTVFPFDTGQRVSIKSDDDPSQNIVRSVPIIIKSPINLKENNRIGGELTLSYSPTRRSRFFINTNLFNSENIGNFRGVNLDRSNFSWS